MRVHLVETAEFSIQIRSYQMTEECIVARKTEPPKWEAPQLKGSREQLHLREFSGAIDSFEGKQFSSCGHDCPISLAYAAKPASHETSSHGSRGKGEAEKEHEIDA